MLCNPTCVCGCPKSRHTPTRMCVELPDNDKPLYQMPPGGWGGIQHSHDRATYVFMHCTCGCTMFEPLQDVT